jgi:hypothetical protein
MVIQNKEKESQDLLEFTKKVVRKEGEAELREILDLESISKGCARVSHFALNSSPSLVSQHPELQEIIHSIDKTEHELTRNVECGAVGRIRRASSTIWSPLG